VTELEAGRCGLVTQRMGVILSQAVSRPAAQLRVRFADFEGLPLLNFRPLASRRPFELLKRSFDVLISAMLLVAFAPLMLVTAMAILLTSKGPLLYRSVRVGRGGRHFHFLKFRSMYQNAGKLREMCANEKDGHLFKAKKDPRITPLGRIMRRYSIDELPQLFNVLQGDMSLVGPRPLPATDLDPDGQSHNFAYWSDQRSGVLPGITGLWQIRGRSDLAFQDMMRLDLQYIQNWSFGFDIRIFFETPVVVLTGRGAY
jgi:lipopolysaccharide/colanic/teichoic acid biosynthesis glycosyltransferase